MGFEWRRRSVNEHPAVDIQRDAGQIRGQVAREKETAVRHVYRVTKAIERYALEDFDLELRRKLAAGNVGLDEPRRDRVDADVVSAELACHRLAESKDTGLGRRVVR